MNRREYLALGGGFLVAGCTSLGTPTGSDGDPAGTATPTVTATETAATPTRTETPASDESHYKLIEIGSRDDVDNPEHNRPHDLTIVNAGESAREFAITITAQHGDSKQTETVLDTSYEVPNARKPRDEAPWRNDIHVEFLEPATYSIDLQVPATETGEQLTVRQDDFNCNWHDRWMIVHGDGRIETGGMATTMGCSTPD